MDLNQPRPRINASRIASHIGRAVCVLGMAHSVDSSGMSFQLKTSDDQDVTIQMEEALQEYVKDLVEIHGTVQDNRSIKCHNYVLFAPENSQNFDMSSYNRAVELMHQVPEHYPQGVQPA